MRNSIFPIFFSAMLIMITIPVASQIAVEKEIEDSQIPFKIYFKCYVETTVHGEFEPEEPHPEHGFFLSIHKSIA